MAQIKTACSHRMITAVFVAIAYQTNELEANFSALKNGIYYDIRIKFKDLDIDLDGKTYRMIQSIVPDPENDYIFKFIESIPDYCTR